MKTKVYLYPRYKKVLWRFFRVFVSTFLIAIGTGMMKIDDPKTVMLSALSAGFVALGKAIREYYKEYVAKNKVNYGNILLGLVRKLPF